MADALRTLWICECTASVSGRQPRSNVLQVLVSCSNRSRHAYLARNGAKRVAVSEHYLSFPRPGVRAYASARNAPY